MTTMLVIEDKPLLHTMLRGMHIGGRTFHRAEASDGRAGLALWCQSQADVLGACPSNPPFWAGQPARTVVSRWHG